MELLSRTDLERLVRDAVSETTALEYSDYTGAQETASEEETELLLDILSMANSGGGTIVIGLETKDGVPLKVTGVPVPEHKVHPWMLTRLEQLKKWSDPLYESVHLHAIPLDEKNSAFVIEIRPDGDLHAMRSDMGALLFPKRQGPMRVLMNVRDIETAVRRTVELDDWIISFITERLVAIQTDSDTPGPAAVLHIVPDISFRGRPRFDLAKLADMGLKPVLGGETEVSRAENGFLVRSVMPSGDGSAVSYAAWTVGGNMEAAYFAPTAHALAADWDRVADGLLTSGDTYIRALLRLGVPLPWRISGALLGMKNEMREDIMEDRDLMVYTHDSLDQVQTAQVICYTKEEVRDALRNVVQWMGEAFRR